MVDPGAGSSPNAAGSRDTVPEMSLCRTLHCRLDSGALPEQPGKETRASARSGIGCNTGPALREKRWTYDGN